MRKVLFTACSVGLLVAGMAGLGHASETDWAIIIKAGSGGNWYGPMDSGGQTNAFASTIAGVQDDSAIRDTKDGNPPASSPGSTANSAWYRPQWMKNDGTDSTSWPWAFGSDYRTPLNNTSNLVKTWEDLIVWANPGFINGGTPNDPSDDHPDIHLFVTTQVNKLAPSSQIPDGKTVAQPIVYKLVMTQWPAGYDGPKEFLLADPADPNLPRNGSPATAKILLADIVLPAAGTEAVNPITGTGPLTATQTAGYRFNLVTPEPGSMLVLASGLTGLLGLVSRRRKA
ncbi:MAG: PEP-CTERM sorting domain-containing protein [Armatimonadetes bacterium]|nr:PEP-CTERM sorting domain-containing protein [Armatimonadota bacterium]